jgi:hypothetical protein
LIRHRWRSHIKNTHGEAELLALVRDYLAEWTPLEREQLPSAAWPARIQSKKELAQWAFRLGELHAEFTGGPPQTLARLQDMLLFFTHASVRMAQLAHAAVPDAKNERGD